MEMWPPMNSVSTTSPSHQSMERRSADDARTRIDAYLATRPNARDAKVVPLTGDASDRRYFRILVRDETAHVLAVHPGPIDFEALPFVNVAKLLSQLPVPVPRILGHSNELGIIALQDLGDVTLQAHLGAASPAQHAALYRQAVSFIDTLQRRGAELASEPRVLCHRDYHSRNLMLHNGSLYIIDFQDARMGPDTYDLVSLLRDSYVDFTEAQVDALMAFFLALRDGRLPTRSDPAEFRRRFDVMALQRNLKALGTFGFQTTSRQNTVYIQYIPRTLTFARANLVRYPRFARLRELLAEHVEELR